MAMGTRRHRQRQEELWYRGDLAEAPGHPFYLRLNELLGLAGSDAELSILAHRRELLRTGARRPKRARGGRCQLTKSGDYTQKPRPEVNE